MGAFCGFFRPRSSVELFLYEELDWKELEKEYATLCCQHSAMSKKLSATSEPPDWADLLAKQWLETIRQIYEEKDLPKEGFSTEIVKTTGKELSRAVDKGYSIIKGIEYEEIDHIARDILKRNVWKFSVAKNHNDLIRLNNLLINKDGSIRAWNDFKREALSVIGTSNRYLKTEYDTIIAGAMMSRKWQDIQRDKYIFPLVQFKVVQDDRTSEICSPLHNIICKVDDPFLAHYFPPNHFNCRTDVIKLRDGEPTPQKELPYIDIPKAFLNNVGETGEIFTKDNPYIKNTPKRLTSDLEYYKDGNIWVSSRAKKHTSSENERPRVEREFENRIITAKALQKHLDLETKVLPEIKPNHWAYDYHFEGIKEYGKVPDFKIGEDFWEMESYEGKFKIDKIGKMIKHGQEQADKVVIKLNHDVYLNRIIEQIKKLKELDEFNFSASEVAVVSKTGKVIYWYK